MKKEQLQQDNEYSFPYHYIPKYKDGFTENYNWSWGKQYASAIEFILDEIKKDDQFINSIVDLGCGDGRITKELAETFNNKKILGIDYSSKAINLAKALNPYISFLNIDIVNEKIEEKFDAITLIEVFEHIPLDLCDDFTKVLPDLLNENGKIYLTVPHENKILQDKHFQHFNYKSLVKYF
ncbi:class I SAM-dependent methyltransferase, partial [Candidatus Pelagibacter ubique]|nr:class I SAM-dependent methyltransferase [Candidatus Pelagibacter ubique]